MATFKLIECWIEGVRPMLQHRATEEGLSSGDKTRSNNPGVKQNPRDEAEKVVYRTPEGQLAVPGSAFARLLREAGGSYTNRGTRKSVKYTVPAAVVVTDDLYGLYLHDRRTPLTDYEVDSRPVTIPATKGRVMRHRPRFNEWSCKVTIRLDEEILSEDLIRQLMGEGLTRIGIGDFRPEKGGPFGTAHIVSWVVINEPLPTAAQTRNTRSKAVA